MVQLQEMTSEQVASMSAPKQLDASMVDAFPDHQLRRGGGMQGDRQVISYEDCLRAHDRNPSSVGRFAIAMAMPGADGTPGVGGVLAMPAEKRHKWYGQGYRPVGYTFDPPPPPVMWSMSMIEDAITENRPIPEDMRPPGYYGRTFIPIRPEPETDPGLASITAPVEPPKQKKKRRTSAEMAEARAVGDAEDAAAQAAMVAAAGEPVSAKADAKRSKA